MSTSKEAIIEGLNSDLWDLEGVTTAIETRKVERALKGETMNIFALKVDHPVNDNELILFIDTLKEHIDELAPGTRIQLAVQSGEHWFPIDIEVREEGNLSILIPEAGFSPSTFNAMYSFLNLFPKAEIYRFYPESKTIEGIERQYMIQADGSSCSRFALQQLYSLQHNADLHERLRASQPFLKKELIDPHRGDELSHYAITFSNSPPELAAIFKSTQSVSALKLPGDAVLKTEINKKGETLEEFSRRHAKTHPKTGRSQNLAIMNFKEKEIKKVSAFLKKLEDSSLEEILRDEKRMGLDFLKKVEHREKRGISEFETKDFTITEEKEERNVFLQKINKLLREEHKFLGSVEKKEMDSKRLEKVTQLKENLETLRREFMETSYSKGKSLSQSYGQLVKKLLKLDDQIKKLDPEILRSSESNLLLGDIRKMIDSSKSLAPTFFKRVSHKLSYLHASPLQREAVKVLSNLKKEQIDDRLKKQIDSIRGRILEGATKEVICESLIDLKERMDRRLKNPEAVEALLETLQQDSKQTHKY